MNQWVFEIPFVKSETRTGLEQFYIIF